jgi:outer membrane protein OmpU
MKKQLLTSSALVAAGVFALAPAAFSKPSLTVNGYHEQVLGMPINQDEDVSGDKSSFDVHHETEIHFNGRVKLDNGITMRAHTELETNGDQGFGGNSTGGPDYIDEIYLIINGSFGSINIGSLDNVGARMVTGFIGSWPTGVGQNLAFDSAEWVSSAAPDFDTVRDSRLIGQDSDSEKINYFTPRFGGFQVGVSYIPGDRSTEDQNGAMQTAATTYHDGFAIGTNYVNKVGDVGIGMGFGYLHMQAPETAAVPLIDDPMKAAVFGLRIDVGPLRVAVGGKRTASNETGGTDRRGRIIDVGARYTMGANMYSLTYADGERQSQTIRYQAAMLSYARILGPGVKWHANLFYTDSKSGAAENNGFAVSTGVRLSF